MLALILIAVAAGVAVALQGQAMGAMDRSAGTATSVAVTYGIGGLVAVAFFLLRRPPSLTLRSIPWYGWTAGLLGLVIVGGIGYAAPRLGLAKTLIVTIAAQLVAALLLDQERSFDVSRLAGVLLTIAGAWLVVK